MILKSRSLGSAAIVSILIALPVAAKDAGLPSIDLQTTCRNREKALGESLSDQTRIGELYASCMKSEQEAKTALLAAWKEIPARHRTSCIKPSDYAASYMEWIACLELVIDMKSLKTKK
jgi:hypothetical protein